MKIRTLLLLLWAGLAAAQEPDDLARAKRFFNDGMARFRLSEYDAAIDLWQEGFRVRPVPEFLYNMAQAYRLSGRSEKALAFYQNYLEMQPRAANRPDVERHMATLTRVLVEQKRALSQPPQGPMMPAPERATPPPATAPAPQITSAPELTRAALPPKKVKSKRWIWGVVVGGAVAIGGAVAAGVVLGQRSGASTHQLPDLQY